MTEKRQFRRVPLAVAVEARAGGRTYHFESRNISVGGMLLRGDETLRENETFEMKFSLPGLTAPVSVTGIVQHVSPEAFMGVRFGDLTADVRAAIERYVKEVPVPQP
ncbi:MAG: PilZ domain-containing protein [Candidatus Acidiferrales bacterium]